jgi:sRNA-binding carbon storage regulator CsrA
MNLWKNSLFLILLCIDFLGLHAQALNGTKTINPNAAGPNNYTSLAQAIQSLNQFGVTSPGVTFLFSENFTETAPTTGYQITATGTNNSPIVFKYDGQAAKPVIIAQNNGIYSNASNSKDVIMRFIGSDYVTLDGIAFIENSSNTTFTTQMEVGIGFFRANDSNGCQYNTIKNCSIKLKFHADITVGSIVPEGSNGIGFFSSKYESSNTYLYSKNSFGSNSFNTITSNLISNCTNGIVIIGELNANLQPANADKNNCIGGTDSLLGNTIVNWGSPSNSNATAIKTYIQSNVLIANNKLNNKISGSENHIGGYLFGIEHSSNSQNVKQKGKIQYNNINIKILNNNASTYGIYCESADSIIIEHNTIDSIFYFGSSNTNHLYGIELRFTNTKNNIVRKNIIRNVIYHTISLINNPTNVHGISIAGQYNLISENTLENIALNSTGYVNNHAYGIYVNDSNNRISKNILKNINVITNFSGIRISGFNQIDSNILFNFNTSRNSASITGINIQGKYADVYRNHIYNFTSSNINFIYGIRYVGNVVAENITIRNNHIHDFTSNSSNIIAIEGKSRFSNVYGNKIHSLTTLGSSGVCKVFKHDYLANTVNFHHNFISDISSPKSNINNPSVIAIDISLSDSMFANVYNNSVYINSTSSGTNFTSTVIYHYGRTTKPYYNLSLKNNIFINTSTAKGSGKTCIIRNENQVFQNIDSSSGKNIYYAGIPSSSNLIYYDGTNQDQTVAAMQARLFPREQGSIQDTIPFVNKADNDLHHVPNLSSKAESNGIYIANDSFDIDGDSVVNFGSTATNYRPDIGADSFDGLLHASYVDDAPPVLLMESITSMYRACDEKLQEINLRIFDEHPIKSIAAIIWNEYSLKKDTIHFNKSNSHQYKLQIPVKQDTLSMFRLMVSDSLNNISNTKQYANFKHSSNLKIQSNKTNVKVGDTIHLNIITTQKNIVRVGIGGFPVDTSIQDGNVYPTRFKNSKERYFIPASELRKNGAYASTINSIAFNVDSIGSGPLSVANNFQMKIFQTNETSLEGTEINVGDMIYGPVDYTPTKGLNVHNFFSPFNWNGISNLVVEICFYRNTIGTLDAFHKVKVNYCPTNFTSHAIANIGNPCNYGNFFGSVLPNMYVETGTVSNNINWLIDSNSTKTNSTSNTIKVSPKKAGLHTYKFTTLIGSCVVLDSITIQAYDDPIIELGEDTSICTGDSIQLSANYANAQYKWFYNGVLVDTNSSIFAKAQGLYKLNITTSFGISVSDSINISLYDDVRPNLPASLIYCKNDSLIINTPILHKTYLWNTGDTSASIKVNTPGLYTLQIIDTISGCVGIDSVLVTKGVDANSEFTINIIDGLRVEFLAKSLAGQIFLWDFDDPASGNNSSQLANPTHIFSERSTYNVCLTTTNVFSNCTSKTCNIVYFEGINTIKQNLNLKVFPNPLTQNSVLSYELKNESEVSIEVYNYLGQKLKTIESITKQAPGTYNYSLANLAEYNAPMLLLKVMVDGMVVTEVVTSH